jgi:hypothetical protein
VLSSSFHSWVSVSIPGALADLPVTHSVAGLFPGADDGLGAGEADDGALVPGGIPAEVNPVAEFDPIVGGSGVVLDHSDRPIFVLSGVLSFHPTRGCRLFLLAGLPVVVIFLGQIPFLDADLGVVVEPLHSGLDVRVVECRAVAGFWPIATVTAAAAATATGRKEQDSYGEESFHLLFFSVIEG